MGFFDQGGSGFTPLTDFNTEGVPSFDSMQPQAPIDAFGSVPPEPSKPSIMDRIWGSLGIKPNDITALATGVPQMPEKPPISGMDMAADVKPTFNMPMPQARPDIPPDQAAGMVKPAPMPVPMPQARPANLGQPPQAPAAPPMSILPPQTAAPAPVPPGAQPAGPQQNFLQRLLGGDRGIQQVVGGIGKGAANIQGPGRFASFARGMGHGIEGNQERGDIQTKQRDTADRTKLAIDTFEAKKPIWMSQADYFKARAEQQKAISSGVSASKAWQTTPQGLAHMAETETENWYKTQMVHLGNLNRTGAMEPAEMKQAKEKLDAEREQRLQNAYKKYGIDPKNNGSTPETAMDASKLNPMQMMGMPHGTYYIVPGSKTVKMRDWNVMPPPGYTPGAGWNTGE